MEFNWKISKEWFNGSKTERNVCKWKKTKAAFTLRQKRHTAAGCNAYRNGARARHRRQMTGRRWQWRWRTLTSRRQPRLNSVTSGRRCICSTLIVIWLELVGRSGMIAVLHVHHATNAAVFATHTLVTVRCAAVADAATAAIHTPPNLRLAAAHCRPPGCRVDAVPRRHREEQILIAVVDAWLRHHRRRVLSFIQLTRQLHAGTRSRRHLARPWRHARNLLPVSDQRTRVLWRRAEHRRPMLSDTRALAAYKQTVHCAL